MTPKTIGSADPHCSGQIFLLTDLGERAEEPGLRSFGGCKKGLPRFREDRASRCSIQQALPGRRLKGGYPATEFRLTDAEFSGRAEDLTLTPYS